ncbi:MAG TPA: ArsI/CadI family heavy metal resistance metalloenzyme [Woeseiaceae bacterium]|nr:ArsI/CadI family heavy metal resistance metalloenzyme [Woeseiaceae bacterium]
MKRLHVSLSVEDLDASVRFYSRLFAAGPGVLKPDYARWMLEDPRVNFAISTRQPGRGVNHLGIQAEDDGELAEIHERLQEAGGPVLDEGETTCCYARSKKQWISDPQDVAWETFLTRGESAVYGHDHPARTKDTATGPCC